MSALVKLYPAAWRARYGPEFEALLAERPPSKRDLLDIVFGAVDARLSPQVDSAPVVRHAPVSDRLAGAAAIAGGLLWSLTYLGGWLLQAEGDLSLPILVALGLMLLSLPGTYIVAYARPVLIGAGALVISFAMLFAELLPWGPWILLPTVGILAAIGPGALMLAAARARVRAGNRFRLVLLTMPWPLLGTAVALAGFVPTLVPLPLVVASFLPLGIAWIAMGARLIRGVPIEPSTISTAGGAS